jgi:uridine kinase
LLFDGVFLLRPELAKVWDVRIFVAASFDEVLRRALERDVSADVSRDEISRRYRERYKPGQQLYYADARPEEAADVVVYNDDFGAPRLRR